MDILQALSQQKQPTIQSQPIDDFVKDEVWNCSYWSRFYEVAREERASFLAHVEHLNVGYFDD